MARSVYCGRCTFVCAFLHVKGFLEDKELVPCEQTARPLPRGTDAKMRPALVLADRIFSLLSACGIYGSIYSRCWPLITHHSVAQACGGVIIQRRPLDCLPRWLAVAELHTSSVIKTDILQKDNKQYLLNIKHTIRISYLKIYIGLSMIY